MFQNTLERFFAITFTGIQEIVQRRSKITQPEVVITRARDVTLVFIYLRRIHVKLAK